MMNKLQLGQQEHKDKVVPEAGGLEGRGLHRVGASRGEADEG